MKYYKHMRGGRVSYIGTLPGGEEITEAEYDALLEEIREKAELVHRVFCGDMSADEVPDTWKADVLLQVEKRKAAAEVRAAAEVDLVAAADS